MTRQRAHAELVSAVDDLWAAVCELVLIALEDAPRPADLAVVDDLVDSVSGMQGDVAAWRDLLGRGSSPLTAVALAQLQHQLAGTTTRYWQSIRGYEPVAELRRAARSRNGEWTAWVASVQRSAARCEAPLWATQTACHAIWNELLDTREPPVSPSSPA
jgi:hypothetical protein